MNKKPRSKGITLALTGLLIVTAGLAGVLGGQAYLESASFRNRLSHQLGDRLSRATRLASNLEVTLGLPVKIELHGLSIANPDWASQPEFLSVEQITLAPRLLPLLTGKLSFAVVKSKNARIQIEQNKDGSFSWPTAETEEGRGNTPKQGFLRLGDVTQAEFNNVSINVQGEYNLQLVFTKLLARNGVITGRDQSQVDLEGTLNDQPLSASWSSDNLLWFLSDNPSELTDIKFSLGKNKLGGTLQVDRSITPVGVSGTLQSAHISFVANDNQTSDKLIPSLPLPTAWLKHIQGNIDWRIDKLTLGALIYRQLRATAQVQNAKLKLDPLDAKIGEAGVHMRMAYASSGDGNGASLRASGELDDLDLSQKIQWLSGNDPGAGYLDLRFLAEGVGKNTRALAAMLNGNLQLVMEEGQVSNAWLQRVTSDLGSLINPWSDQDGKTPVRCLAVRLKTTQGKVNIEQMVLDTHAALILGEGSANLATEQVDIVLSPDTRSLDLLKLQLPIRISGSLTALDADLAPTAIITRSGANILNTIASAGGLLEKDLKGGFGSSSAGCKASLADYRSDNDNQDKESGAQ